MNIFFIKKYSLFLLIGCLVVSCSDAPTDSPKKEQSPLTTDSHNNVLTSEEVATGWELLFDGKSTEHWRGYNQKAFPESGWSIDSEGNLTVEDGGGALVTKQKFENFELLLEFMIQDAGNSGIFYRVLEEEDVPIYHNAPEYQILDNEHYRVAADGNIQTRATAECYDLYGSNNDFTKPIGEWNLARIVILNGHVEHWINGERMVGFKLESKEWNEKVAASKFKTFPNFGKTRRGHLGLQEHDHLVKFRNIKIREL